MPPLPPAFLATPIAHRGYHDRAAGRIENSRAAVAAAVSAGYGIEIDLQLSSDGEAVVFHDETLDRLTAATGPVAARTAAGLARIPLTGSGETIPTLPDILALIDGRVPLLIEIKDQDGGLGSRVGALEARAAECLRGYPGPVALMSFNPHSVAACRSHAPGIARGLTTCVFDPADWPGVSAARCADLTPIPDFAAVGASFISHHHLSLDHAAVTALRARGVPILCWTIRSLAEETAARQIAQGITFENYAPAG